MNIQGFFTTDLLNIYDIYGNLKSTEKIHLTRQGISNNDFSHTHKYKGLCEKETQIDEGDLCITESNDKFLVTSMRKIKFLNTNQVNLWKCDYECKISRLQDKYVGNIRAGKEEVVIKDNIPCVQKDVNGKMQIYDAGLLEGTIKIIYVQYVEGIELTDRLTINNKTYQINSLDTSMKNILCIQLTEDKRK